jgi:hypothetical protein
LGEETVMDIGVALIFFTRLETTRQTFAAIRAAQPKTLFLICDGPRDEREAELVAAARAITNEVDWDCEVHRFFADHNYGVGVYLGLGMQWVFSHVEAAIFLEDDCVPDPTFFPFCYELLEKYQDDERVMLIAGSNFTFGLDVPHSYYFGTYGFCWGWASWRRAFAHYDPRVTTLPRSNAWLYDLLQHDQQAVDFWASKFAMLREGTPPTWDWAWLYAIWSQGGLSITPRTNLVTNTGFGELAINNKDPNHPFANQPTVPMKFPLVHPDLMIRNGEADAILQRAIIGPEEVLSLRGRVAGLLPSYVRNLVMSVLA